MSAEAQAQVTHILELIQGGDGKAVDSLMPAVYEEFKALAQAYLRRERAGHTLQPTALVHEVYLKMVDQTRVQWQGRAHFFAVGARIMRRILVDHARYHARDKRGGGRARITLEDDLALSPDKDEDLLAVDEALEKLTKVDERQARIVELRFFGGLNMAEVAEVVGVSKRTVESDWTMVRAWLRRELSPTGAA